MIAMLSTDLRRTALEIIGFSALQKEGISIKFFRAVKRDVFSSSAALYIPSYIIKAPLNRFLSSAFYPPGNVFRIRNNRISRRFIISMTLQHINMKVLFCSFFDIIEAYWRDFCKQQAARSFQ